MGGIMTATDVVEFLLAGASAVQIGTANFVDPRRAERIVDDLATWCAQRKVARVTDLVGGLRT
jgi:dihydroorotate dehydrogenase (NAD+) catalytic subunit